MNNQEQKNYAILNYSSFHLVGKDKKQRQRTNPEEELVSNLPD